LRHLAVLEHADSTALNGKTVQRRAAGRFYTHELIAAALARQLAERIASNARPVSIIDPFAGDGRLVVHTMETLAARGVRDIDVAVWDYDECAVGLAGRNVQAAASALGLSIDLEVWAGDTFDRAVNERRTWTAVVTNPPWELLKPDRREMDLLPLGLRDEYVTELRAFDDRLASEFPVSQPSRRFAGWGTNLSRVGTEVALRLTARGGVCGVVCPSSLLADSTTSSLRRWLLENFALTDVSHYPAEARLFEAVDVPCCTFVAVRGAERSGTRLTRVGANRKVADQAFVSLDPAWLEQRDYAIPVQFGANGIELLSRFDAHPRFSTLECPLPTGLWAGRELDETGRAFFTMPAGDHPFVRSLHVRRLSPVRSPPEYLDTTRREVPRSSEHVRLVWRDISRPSQTRRIHAALLEPGCVTGNSVSVAYFRDDDQRRLLALLAAVSSLPFEFQVRSLLMTNHVSLSVMRAARLPVLDGAVVAELSVAARRCLDGHSGAEPRLEVAVASAYGLDRDTWERLASHFDLADEDRTALQVAWSDA
jgi:Alw26I/Eco31I/Esp3I family type II restriction m6 adenine DNA methyltransferase